jgi:hypothetical protein
MIKNVILGNPDYTAQRSIDRLHKQFQESELVDEPAWAKEFFRDLREQAFDHERADRMMHGQCTGEFTRL